ncbi:restriction endonuclease subunit S [Blautia massiliensis (ex Durand et al. 2017)]|uniref:restriction endonuclease subunit S n=1 Tax=Blautia TaxID=572511 RepID=UPI001D13E546|nr:MULTISPECIES: restriction endonuclease subunit S [Blautia]UEA27437.1 restriction endonuclease subunit S [Blautia massiliensis (ex Durand et al. 2017)]UWO15822.1 restriction endonuclease subunit S [Blautia sp. KLE_1732_HM_1032]
MEKVKLSDICNPKQWKAISTSDLLNEGYPVYGANGIIGYYNEYNHENPVVTVTCRGATCGSINITVPKAYVTGNAMCLDDLRSDVEIEYLYYCLKHYDFKNIISGSAQPQITRQGMEKIYIMLCSQEEQKDIVNKLKKTEKIIKLTKQKLQSLDNLIKARFVELFVGKKYEIVKAGSIIKEMRNGVSPSTSGGHFEKVLTLSAITQGKFDDKAWKEGFFTDCPSAEKRITEDDFYICRGNGNKSLVGMGVYALENRPDLVFPDTVIAAHIDTERMVLPYLWIMWQQPEVRKQLESGARTTNGTYKINQKVISEIKIICPPINEQEVFADFVKQVNKSKVINQLLQKWNYMYHVTIEKVK